MKIFEKLLLITFLTSIITLIIQFILILGTNLTTLNNIIINVVILGLSYIFLKSIYDKEDEYIYNLIDKTEIFDEDEE